LVDLFPDHEATPTDFDNAVWLLYTSRAYVPRRVRVFVEFIKQRIRDTNPDTAIPPLRLVSQGNREAAGDESLRDGLPALHSLV
jgi:hypothetical protein